MSTKNKVTDYLAQFYLELMKLYKIWKTYSCIHSGHNYCFTSNEAF